MTNIVIIGGGGHAKVIISIIKKQNNFRIIGYTDPMDQGEILGVEYSGNDESLKFLKRDHHSISAVIGIGMLRASDAQKRKQIFDYAISIGFDLPPIVSPDATINECVKICDGTVVMDGVVVNSSSTIGVGAILNTNCSVDHDCGIGDFSHIAPGATLSGNTRIGRNVLIGAGAVVIEGKNITDNVLIGAGSTVVNDIKKSGTYYGNPAKLKS